MSKFDTFSKHFLIEEYRKVDFFSFFTTMYILFFVMDTVFFIHPLLENIHIFVIDSKKRTIIEPLVLVSSNIAEDFPSFLIESIWKYSPKEVWCVTWPGPFTLMRVVTLGINTASFVSNTPLKSLHLFDLIEKRWYTPITIANECEYLLRNSEWTDIFTPKTQIPDRKYIWISRNITTSDYTLWKFEASEVCMIFEKQKKINRLSPLYIKPPHITSWSIKTSKIS